MIQETYKCNECINSNGSDVLVSSKMPAGFNALRDMIKKAQKPIIYFEATGIYSRVIEHFCETNGLRFCES
ncbi:hypothetical protein [Limosilactobacillus reuteri]|uniref:hypothetical protein n=1 Tax=Limosilactobacillus reuteri TaxID=1598 RepID=UPI001E2BB9BD|nr:hypothetical protein [Limosilactobacillus reuteri]